MPAPLNASLPPGFILAYNYIVRVTAQDPTDGTEITDVIVSEVSVSGDEQGVSSEQDMPVFTPPEPQLVPAQLV